MYRGLIFLITKLRDMGGTRRCSPVTELDERSEMD
jgi:hypothetical protein